MHICTAQIFGADNFAGGRLHQGWATQKDRALVFDDNAFVRHGGYIGTTRRATAHDNSHLGNTLSRHVGLVEEYSTKVFAVGKDLILVWQICATGIDQIYTRQIILRSNFLGTKVFFDGQGIISSAFYRCVIADNNALLPFYPTNTRDHPGRGNIT